MNYNFTGWFVKFLILIISLSLLTTRLLPGEEAPKVIIVLDEWKPLKYNTPPYGILARITKEAFAQEGIETEFRVVPWRRGFDEVEAGRYHGALGWNHTPERESIFYITSPLLLEDVVFFHHKDLAFEWENMEDLRGLIVGAVKDYNYGSDFRRASEAGILEVQTLTFEAHSIRMLQKRRIDLWPSEVDVGIHLINAQLPAEEAEQLTYHPRPLFVSDLCLLLSRNRPENEEYLIRFERGLAALKESGRYDELIEEALPRTPGIILP